MVDKVTFFRALATFFFNFFYRSLKRIRLNPGNNYLNPLKLGS